MSDCTTAEVQELLPELMHGRLDEATRLRVERHLARCAECAAELSTLMAVRSALARTPAIDTAAIVRALPRPPAIVQEGNDALRLERGRAPAVTARRPHVPAARRSAVWQIAAALMLVSAGGMSLAVARSYFDGGVVDSGIARGIDSVRPFASGESAVAVPSGEAASAAGAPSLTLGGGVEDMDAAELESLLGALESLEAAPSAEPDVGSVIASATAERSEGGLE